MNRLLILLGSACCAANTHAALPEGIAGPWYNPAQSGHGLSIQLADRGARGIVLWHVYDRNGAPLTLYVDAAVRGRKLVGAAYAPRGLRFGEFDPTRLELPKWGTVAIRFDDCERGELSWQSSDSDFGSGHMEIVRLALIDSLDCSLPVENPIPFGLYLGTVSPGGDARSGLGVVDLEGRLWAYSGQIDGQGFRFDPLHRTDSGSTVFLSIPAGVAADGETSVNLQAVQPPWEQTRGLRTEVTGRWSSTPENVGRFPLQPGQAGPQLEWRPAEASMVRLLAPVDAGRLAGTYTYRRLVQHLSLEVTLTISEDGSACLGVPSHCWYEGHVGTLEGDHGLLDFQLRSTSQRRATPHLGRGWLDDSPSGRRLVLIGDNGRSSLVVVATRKETAQ